jgi:hypothetical protein
VALAERHQEADSDRLRRFEPRDSGVEELRFRLRRIDVRRQRHGDGADAVDAKTEIDVAREVGAADEQPGRDQQRRADGDLRAERQAAEPRLARRRRAAAFDGGDRIEARGLKSRREPERHCAERGDAERVEQHVGVGREIQARRHGLTHEPQGGARQHVRERQRSAAATSASTPASVRSCA